MIQGIPFSGSLLTKKCLRMNKRRISILQTLRIKEKKTQNNWNKLIMSFFNSWRGIKASNNLKNVNENSKHKKLQNSFTQIYKSSILIWAIGGNSLLWKFVNKWFSFKYLFYKINTINCVYFPLHITLHFW